MIDRMCMLKAYLFPVLSPSFLVAILQVGLRVACHLIYLEKEL